MTWSDGRHYSGSFKDGQLHGMGEFYWPHAKYTGMYRGNLKHDKGVFSFSDGSQLNCTFFENVVVSIDNKVGKCNFDSKEEQAYFLFDVEHGKIIEKSIKKTAYGASYQVETWATIPEEERKKTLSFLQLTLDQLPSEEGDFTKRYTLNGMLPFGSLIVE